MKKKILIVVCILIIAVAAVIFLCKSAKSTGTAGNSDSSAVSGDESSGSSAETDGISINYNLGDNICIKDISSYTGDYVEDGSDELADGIMMITIENSGEKSVQLMNITLNGQYQFRLTTLLPGMTMMVLETNRAVYESDMNVDTVETSDVAFFSESLSLREDLYSIESSDGTLTVTNVSAQAAPEGKVFYKNKVSTGYLGGITYCVSIPALQPGESTEIPAGHFTIANSDLLFVTNAE